MQRRFILSRSHLQFRSNKSAFRLRVQCFAPMCLMDFSLKLYFFFFFRSWRQNLIAFLFVCSFPPIDRQRNSANINMSRRHVRTRIAETHWIFIHFSFTECSFELWIFFCYWVLWNLGTHLYHKTVIVSFKSQLLTLIILHATITAAERNNTPCWSRSDLFQERFSSSCAAVKRNRQLDLVEVLGLDATRLDTFLHPFPVPHHHVNKPFAEHCRCWLRVKKKFYFKIKV